MFQVRFHGRGGQGVVNAAELPASAAFSQGMHAQAFPGAGSERMGAPVTSFYGPGEALRPGRKVPVAAAPTGKRVMVVGAGPSGLSAACHLTRLGHVATTRDTGAEPTG